MAGLTTHVLDLVRGLPAAHMRIELWSLDGDARRLALALRTNADGRCDQPLLSGESFRPGQWELLFHVAEYFSAQAVAQQQPPFLDCVPIRFTIAPGEQHYHVPLLVSPWAYSTYRGS